jgi:2'-5' RNA ligase
MHGIVSLLDNVHNDEVEKLWQELEADCGLTGVQITPIPHFSWHIAQDYDLNVLRVALEDIAAISTPFVVKTTGIGLFTGERPVIFIALVKDEALLRFHEMVWQQAQRAAFQPSPYYNPASWMPHITLAHGDTDWMQLTCAMEKLVFQPFNWEILVDNLALINQDEGHVGERTLYYRFGPP